MVRNTILHEEYSPEDPDDDDDEGDEDDHGDEYDDDAVVVIMEESFTSVSNRAGMM
jgi:hypothetical protein